jgi:hypothetical protein
MHIEINVTHVRVDDCKVVCAKLFVGCCFCYGRLSMSSAWSWSLPSTCGATLSDKLSSQQAGRSAGRRSVSLALRDPIGGRCA